MTNAKFEEYQKSLNAMDRDQLIRECMRLKEDADKTYNGWSNFETWSLALNINNGGNWLITDFVEHMLNDVEMTADELRQLKENDREWEISDHFEDYITSAIETDVGNSTVYQLCDLWSQREIDNVDWVELVQNLVFEELDDLLESIGEE